MIVAATATVVFSTRNFWAVIAGFLLLVLASGFYFAHNFAITTDSSKLLSESLPWRSKRS